MARSREEEIRGLVQGTFLAEAPLVRTNAPAAVGLAEMRGGTDQGRRNCRSREKP